MCDAVAWQTGETVSISIGQSFVLVTPLQMAGMIYAMFNGGRLYQPKVIKWVGKDKRKVYTPRKRQFKIIAFSYLMFFFFAGRVINHYFLPEKFHPISLLGNVVILLFMMFLGWSFIKPNVREST